MQYELEMPCSQQSFTPRRHPLRGVQLDGQGLFFAQKSLLSGPAPVRRYLPYLMELVLKREINPGRVFDLEVPLTDVAAGYRAMDERKAIKTMLRM